MADIPKGLGSMKDLLARFTKAQARWELWRSAHQEAFDFAAPERETFRFRSPGQRKNRHIFDSTAVLGLAQFASRIQGSVIPSWQQWMTFTAGDEIPKDEKDKVNEQLEESTDIFFSHINHSNFSTEITPSLSDLGIGTGAILVEEGKFGSNQTLKFTNVPLAELYPEMPPGGPVESVWRKQSVLPRNIPLTWPDAVLPTKLANMVKDENANEVEIKTGMLFNEKDSLYHQVVIFEKDLIFTQSFDSKRLIVFRWHVTPGEVFGRGPIMQVMADIRTANKVKQFMLENAALQMAGVYTGVSDGVFNPHTVRIAPASIIPVSTNNTANPALAPLPLSGNLGLGDLILGDLQENIKKALLVDPLGEVTDPVKSATEQIIRNQESLKLQGASLGRLKSELVEPLVNAVVDILRDLGKMPEFTVDGNEVTIKQQSPLAKAEDIEDFQNSQIWWGSVQGLPPQVLALAVKVEELPKFWADKLGVPASLVRNDEERATLGKTLQEAAETGLEQGDLSV